MDELLDAIRLVYQDIPLTDSGCDASAVTSSSALRAAFVNFVFCARFFFLNDKAFSSFLDTAPVFALDLFRVMRSAADFVALSLDAYCSFCRSKPTRLEKGLLYPSCAGEAEAGCLLRKLCVEAGLPAADGGLGSQDEDAHMRSCRCPRHGWDGVGRLAVGGCILLALHTAVLTTGFRTVAQMVRSIYVVIFEL